MPLLDIVTVPNKVLRAKAKAIKKVDYEPPKEEKDTKACIIFWLRLCSIP